MVNKREKTERVTRVTATAAPKSRVASKPKVAKTTKPTKAKAKKTPEVRHEDIAFRAYLIAEKRQQVGLPGDPMSDWVEAERQLLSERATHGVN